MDKNLEMAKKIASKVERAGGRAYFVGGCVRDALLGRENKDIDIEVHRVPVETLEGILDALGERISMGASFGVLGLRHYDLDIAMPRAETATGFGHKDFAVSVDPFLGEEKAASRRDFTINARLLRRARRSRARTDPARERPELRGRPAARFPRGAVCRKIRL